MNGDGTLELLVKLNGRSIKQGSTHIGFTLIDENNAGDTNIIDFALAAQTRRVPLPIYDGENIVLPLKQDKRIEFTSINGSKQFPTQYNWVKLVRKENVFTLYGSSDGTNWNFIDDTYRLVPHQLDLQVSSQNARFNLDKFTSIEIAEPTFYFHNDHLGSPKVMSNVSGQQIWKSDLAPYGESMGEEFRVGNLNIQGTMMQVDSAFRFPGQYENGLTGLNYNYFRDYDPQTARYIQSDPIGLAGGLNTYAYVGGDPVNAVDPFGLEVSGTYNKNTGIITVTNLDNGESVSAGAFSGMPGQYASAPNGTYTVSDFPWGSAGQDHYFALLLNDGRLDDYADGHQSNYDPNQTMSNIRLHSGLVSHACVTIPSASDASPWLPIQNMLNQTSQGEPVIIGGESFPNYGSINVIGSGFGSVPP